MIEFVIKMAGWMIVALAARHCTFIFIEALAQRITTAVADGIELAHERTSK